MLIEELKCSIDFVRWLAERVESAIGLQIGVISSDVPPALLTRAAGASGNAPSLESRHVLHYFNVDTGAVKLAVVKGMDENIETRP